MSSEVSSPFENIRLYCLDIVSYWSSLIIISLLLCDADSLMREPNYGGNFKLIFDILAVIAALSLSHQSTTLIAGNHTHSTKIRLCLKQLQIPFCTNNDQLVSSR